MASLEWVVFPNKLPEKDYKHFDVLKQSLEEPQTCQLSRYQEISRYWTVVSPVWKVCIAQRISPARNFDAFYIFTIKFLKSPARNFQTFQSVGLP